MFAGGLIVRVLLATSSLGDCSSSLAAHYKKYFGYYNKIGQLIISKVFTAQDLVLLSQRYSAFQGRNQNKVSLRLHLPAVSLLLPKTQFKGDYLKSTNKETLGLTDKFYSIMRTMYR